MRKSIYRLLNDVTTDLTEYKELELSAPERDRHKQKILMEVNNMKHTADRKRTGTKRKLWMGMAGAAAALAITVSAVSMADPVLAKEVFQSLFGPLLQNAQGDKYEEEDTALLTKVEEHAVSVQDLETAGGKDYFLTAEQGGVTLSVSDVYCDGYTLYFTASLTGGGPGLLEADGILADPKAGPQELSVDGMQIAGWEQRPFEPAEDGAFVTMQQITLLGALDSMGRPADPGADSKDTLTIDWTIPGIKGCLWDAWDEQGEYQQTGAVEGPWHLRFPVTVDRTANESFTVSREENGIFLTGGIRTKTGLILLVDLPDFGQTPYADPVLQVVDPDGQPLQWIAQRSEVHEDGTSLEQIMVLYDGQTDLTLEAAAKNAAKENLARIRFQVP